MEQRGGLAKLASSASALRTVHLHLTESVMKNTQTDEKSNLSKQIARLIFYLLKSARSWFSGLSGLKIFFFCRGEVLSPLAPVLCRSLRGRINTKTKTQDTAPIVPKSKTDGLCFVPHWLPVTSRVPRELCYVTFHTPHQSSTRAMLYRARRSGFLFSRLPWLLRFLYRITHKLSLAGPGMIAMCRLAKKGIRASIQFFVCCCSLRFPFHPHIVPSSRVGFRGPEQVIELKLFPMWDASEKCCPALAHQPEHVMIIWLSLNVLYMAFFQGGGQALVADLSGNGATRIAIILCSF